MLRKLVLTLPLARLMFGLSEVQCFREHGVKIMETKWTKDELFAFASELRGVVTIGKRAEEGDARSFDCFARNLPLRSLYQVFEYGFQRFVNDKVGGSDTTLEDKFTKASDILVHLANGTWGLERKARKESVDPVVKEATAMARAFFKPLAKETGWYKKMGTALGLPFGTEDEREEVMEAAIERRAAREDVLAEARKVIDARKNAKTIDLSDLGI